MEDSEDLEASLKQYFVQLKQIKDALSSSDDASDRHSLESLRNDLMELINLTVQTLNSRSNQSTNVSSDEMVLTESCETTASDATDCDNDDTFEKKLQSIKDELQAMVGKRCSAPHTHSWGVKSFHNAIVCNLDDSRDYDLDSIKDFKVRVMFTNPTHKEMVPCSYFLDGDCKFDASKCRFSHGELVPYAELGEYKEPDFTQLRRNCMVLAKLQDRIWHKGRVVCVNSEEKTCQVKLDHQKKEVDCEFEDLFPISSDDSDFSSSSDSESDNLGDLDELKHAQLIQQSLLTPAPNCALGAWEKHTRGIGSKLMQKMGYIVGLGLGTNGEGIIVPISAQILPPGRSLDHCMELREAANGDKDLFSVERKLQREKKKQEIQNEKAYKRETNKTDVFSFLNGNILNTSTATEKTKTDEKQNYKNHSTRSLNVQSVKISNDMKKKEQELRGVKEALKRHQSGSDMHKRLQNQIKLKTRELNDLKTSESILEKEQLSRRNKDKLFVF